MPIVFEDNSIKVKSALLSGVKGILESIGGEIASQTERNSRVDSGKTAGSYDYKIEESGSETTVYVGSDEENAIWEEFGTGEYALKGNGRAGAWYVPVHSYAGKKKPTYNGKVVIVHGKNGVDFYKTNGKTPREPLTKAFKATAPKVENRLANEIKGKIGG